MDEGPGAEARMRRRKFLKWISGLGAALAAALVSGPAAAAFVSPGFRKPAKKDWISIADDISTIDIGVPVKLDFVEATSDAWVESRAIRTVWVYTDDGEAFTAFSGVCTHLGCSYSYDATDKQYHCPCHHGLFDVKTGAVLGGPPPRPLDSLPVRVTEDGALEILFQTFRTGVPAKIQV